MNKKATGSNIVMCITMAGVLLLCALSVILLSSVLLTVCIQSEYIDITSINVIRIIIYAVAGIVGGCILFVGKRERSVWEILASICILLIVLLMLNCMLYSSVTMEWGWGIIAMLGGILVSYMVQNHRKARPKKPRAKYRTR